MTSEHNQGGTKCRSDIKDYPSSIPVSVEGSEKGFPQKTVISNRQIC